MEIRSENNDTDKNTYGTDRSEMLLDMIASGHKPIGITVMACEETFIFANDEDMGAALEWSKSEWGNEGWWYVLDEWQATRDWYLEGHYKGNEGDAPKVYWIDKGEHRMKRLHSIYTVKLSLGKNVVYEENLPFLVDKPYEHTIRAFMNFILPNMKYDKVEWTYFREIEKNMLGIQFKES